MRNTLEGTLKKKTNSSIISKLFLKFHNHHAACDKSLGKRENGKMKMRVMTPR